MEDEYLRGKAEGISLALKLVADHDPQTGYDVSPIYWGKTLRNALIEVSVATHKQLKSNANSDAGAAKH